MKKLFVIGGMGAGKSTAAKTLADQGLPLIDLDKVGHEVLLWDSVKQDLRTAFGADVFDETGEVNRRALASVAFESCRNTHKLNNITQSRIEQALTDKMDLLQQAGYQYVVVECSAFKGKESSLAFSADCIVAVIAPMEQRLARAVASGWDEADVRARIAQQISDEVRVDAADVVFSNDGTQDELRAKVIAWWKEYTSQNA